MLLDLLITKTLPVGGDLMAGVTELILWVGASLFLAGAILTSAIDAIGRRTRPKAIAVPARRHGDERSNR
jgi:hypothetical protein